MTILTPKFERKRAVSQLSSILPTLTELQIKGSPGSSSNTDAVQEVSFDDIMSLMDLIDILPGLAQIGSGENEDMKTTEMRALLLTAQADELESKFVRMGLVEDIDKVIEYRSEALALTPDGHEDKPNHFLVLGIAFSRRFERVGELADLNKAVDHLDQGMQLIPDWHVNKPAALNSLGVVWVSAFEQRGELADLSKAIEYLTQAVLLAPDGNPGTLKALNNLARSYEYRFGRLGELGDLNKAIECQTKAVLLIPDEHADKPSLLMNLGELYHSQFGRLGELADLKESIEYKTQAVLLTPNGHPDKSSHFDSLGKTYCSRFERFGEVTDLNKAIEYQTQAVSITPDMPVWLNDLGILYSLQFGRFGELADLSKATESFTQAVLLTPDGDSGKPCMLNNLGNSYSSRFKRLGELEDLNKAIEYRTEALLLTADGHPDKPGLLNNLGSSYQSRFDQLGELASLNKAIKHRTHALLLTPDEHLHKPIWLNNLGTSYLSRFKRLGELADLNKATEYLTQAVLLTPDGHPDKPNWLKNLGNMYRSRFLRLGELVDLKKSIEYKTQAVVLTPNGHPDKPSHLSSLGNSYESSFERFDELTDLNRAIEYQTQAVLLTPDGDSRKPNWLNNLGTSYSSRFERLGELADLNKGIEYQTQAVLNTPDGHADKPNWLYNLGHSYHTRFKYLCDLSDLESAHSYFQNGARSILTDPEMQFRCARLWAECSLYLGSSPQLAYERCMELIPHFIWLGTTIDQRYTLLGKINDLATEAAAWAISTEAFDLALEWLEEGRSIVWNQILQLRTPFDDLLLADPALAEDLKDTATKLEYAVSRRSMSLLNTASSDLEEDTQQHHHLASKWEQLLGRARTIPRLHRFLRPRKADELMLSATDGPVIVLNAHSTRCDALVIFPGCNDIIHLPLSTSSLDKLEEARIKLQSLIGHGGDRKGGFKRSGSTPKPEETFISVLAVCWTDIVQPVLDLLACKDGVPINELPHVTWCTTGALSFLPLHAAGLYDGSQPNAYDLIISSYTPTLSALLPTSPPGIGPRFGVVAVGQEHTRGFCRLPSTVHELAAIKEHAGATQFQQLDSTSATVDAVLGAMESHTWVHLACHATQNLDNPTQSAFHLHDGPLTLEAITKRSFKNKGLAFLSACQTATGDERLAEEAVHLAAGILMAGYPSVIATMWVIQDEDGPTVAEAVYADLLKDGGMDHTQAARALHKAVAGLRKRVGDDAFKRWVPFIHIGV